MRYFASGCSDRAHERCGRFHRFKFDYLSSTRWDGTRRQTRNPAALLLADVELSFLDTAFRPSLGLGLSAQGREHFNVSPTWTAAIQYRVEVTQWVPFLYARCFGNLRDDWWHRGSVGLGLDRLYQGGYQISFITGPTMRFNQNPRVGVLVLLSIGYQDTYNELY